MPVPLLWASVARLPYVACCRWDKLARLVQDAGAVAVGKRGALALRGLITSQPGNLLNFFSRQ
jgi:hypothetical protein